MVEFGPRKEEKPIEKQFLERWSPRSFDASVEMTTEDLETLVSASKWAPSCFNEQPWKFVLARKSGDKFETFLNALADKNQLWVKNTAAIGFVVANQNFAKNDKKNAWAEFDCGAAWMAFALQARASGFAAHAMAGFDADKAEKILGLSEDQKVMCALAVGKPGEPENVPEEFGETEAPNDRKSLDEILEIF